MNWTTERERRLMNLVADSEGTLIHEEVETVDLPEELFDGSTSTSTR